MANVLDRNFDFATNGTVTAAGLHNLIDDTNIYAGLISTQEERTSVGTADLLLIANSSSIGSPQIAANRTTVYNLFEDALTGGTYVNAQLSGNLTYGTATGNRTISTGANITNGTISTLIAGTTTSTAATITNGTITTGLIPTLTAGTTTGTAGIFTSGTVATLNSTTGTIGTLNSTIGTITALNSTTPTFLGAITASTNTINVGSGQIYKDADGNVGIGTTNPTRSIHILKDGGNNFSGIRSQNNNSGTGIAGIEFSSDATYSKAAIGLVRALPNGAGSIVFYNSSSTNASSWSISDERIRIGEIGQIGIGGANYGTSGQVLTSNGSAAAPSWTTSFGAKAWCRFDGRTTGTNAPTAGGNVATVARTATGTYLINFTTPMADANYSILVTGDGPVNGNHCVGFVQATTSSQASIAFWNTSNSTLKADPTIACVSVFSN